MPDRITMNFICPPSVYNIVRKDVQVHRLNSFANLHQARTPRIYPLYLHQYCCCQLYIIAQSVFLFSIEVYQDHNNKPYCKPCETKPKISFLFSPFCSIWAWFTTIRVWCLTQCLKQIIAVRSHFYFPLPSPAASKADTLSEYHSSMASAKRTTSRPSADFPSLRASAS